MSRLPRLALVGLAACWSSSKPPPPAARPVAAQPAPAAANPVAPPAAATPAPAKPAPAKPRYVMPKPIADALATEPIAGNVLVPAGVPLHASLAAARAASPTERLVGTPHALRVIRDHGDVVEVATEPVADCAQPYMAPYQLTVFVRRDQLRLRAKTEVVKLFPDGTGVAIDRGAGVMVTAHGLAWDTRGLAEAPVAPAEGQLTYAVPAGSKPAALPPLAGEQLVCERTRVTTLAEWRAERQRTREAEARRRAEQRRAEMEARMAQLERERAAREAKRKAEAAKRAKANAKSKKPKTLAEAFGSGLPTDSGIADLLGSSGGGGMGDLDTGFGAGSAWDPIDMHPPSCHIADAANWSYDAPSSRAQTPPPKINGVIVSWPGDLPWRQTVQGAVVRANGRYFGDVEHRCGRTRLTVGEGGVSAGGGGMGMLGGGQQVQLWVPKRGPVTWPDGTPAGTYTGSERYAHVEEIGNKICVRVRDIAESVCHPKHTTTTVMGYPPRSYE